VGGGLKLRWSRLPRPLPFTCDLATGHFVSFILLSVSLCSETTSRGLTASVVAEFPSLKHAELCVCVCERESLLATRRAHLSPRPFVRAPSRCIMRRHSSHTVLCGARRGRPVGRPRERGRATRPPRPLARSAPAGRPADHCLPPWRQWCVSQRRRPTDRRRPGFFE